jgi:hypothetical protein
MVEPNPPVNAALAFPRGEAPRCRLDTALVSETTSHCSSIRRDSLCIGRRSAGFFHTAPRLTPPQSGFLSPILGEITEEP